MPLHNAEQLEYIKGLLNKCSLVFDSFEQLHGTLVIRDVFLNTQKYNSIVQHSDFHKVKDVLSSSSNTAVHKSAKEKQKFPLLNLVRQLLRTIHYKMTPIRKSDGYNSEGKKQFKRYFLIEKMKHFETASIVSTGSFSSLND
jgi:hypothetical protein